MKITRTVLTFLIILVFIMSLGLSTFQTNKVPRTINNQMEQSEANLNENELELIGQFRLSFYSPSADETDNSPLITATGAHVKPGITAAVDPRYWKLGTKFYIEGYGYVVAEDTGSKIKGPNKMDVCVETKDQALKNGIQYRNVWVVRA